MPCSARPRELLPLHAPMRCPWHSWGSPQGCTPLFVAALKGHAEVVNALLEAKADKDAAAHVSAIQVAPQCTKAPMRRCASFVISAHCMRWPLAPGLPRTAQQERMTPLHIAALMGHAEVVNALLEAKADKDAANEVRTFAV
jgi:ankyrin repeat protein